MAGPWALSDQHGGVIPGLSAYEDVAKYGGAYVNVGIYDRLSISSGGAY